MLSKPLASKRPQAASPTPESTAVVVRHNKLIESKHSLSLPERRFVLWIVSQIKPEDADFHLYRRDLPEKALHYSGSLLP